MNIVLCPKRQQLLATNGHVLVLGGPGCGKTTIALLKAQRVIPSLKPGQEVLFLSFSRAAVRQILVRCRSVLTRTERATIKVKTYHAFCLGLLQAHGKMLNGKSVRFVAPGEERLLKSDFQGDWDTESRRFARDDSVYCFDQFADGAASLLERSAALRALLGDKYPLVIVDEFQDTGNDQWRLVKAFGEKASVLCMADTDQRIFEYRPDVDPLRVDHLRAALKPTEFDLGGENHRSAGAAGILQFADAVLKNAPLPSTADVKTRPYFASNLDSTIHSAVVWMRSDLIAKGIQNPTVAVLARTNDLIMRASAALTTERTINGVAVGPVQHDVVWDAELSAAAAVVVGSVLDWATLPRDRAVASTLGALNRYFRLKNAVSPSNSAAEMAKKFKESQAAVVSGSTPRTKAAKQLLASFDAHPLFVGDPVHDWRTARDLLAEVAGMDDVMKAVRLVRLFRATDALATGLSELWLESGSYLGAAELVRKVLEQEQLFAGERDPEGCVLMNMHKSKGKEFDGVVIVEGQFSGQFLNPREPAPHEPSRRLLRVAITRARRSVTLVRPSDAPALVG